MATVKHAALDGSEVKVTADADLSRAADYGRFVTDDQRRRVFTINGQIREIRALLPPDIAIADSLGQYLDENPADGRRIIDKSLTAARAREASLRLAAASLARPTSLRASPSSSEASSTLPAAVLCNGISLPRLTRMATGLSACTARR